MLEAITPVNSEWIHEFLIEPSCEGAARINLAWKGINSHSLRRPSLSLEERVTHLILGSILIMPFINTIIWIAWQVFGSPDRLSDPYCAESAKVPVPILLRKQRPQMIAPRQYQVKNDEHFSYSELEEQNPTTSDWKLQFVNDLIIAREDSDNRSTTSFYNTDWIITEFHQQAEDGKLQTDINMTNSKTLQVRYRSNTEEIKKEFILEDNLLWVQQLTLGLRSFVQAKEQTELRFCTVITKNKYRFYNLFLAKPPLLLTYMAKKTDSELEGVTKIDIICESGWPYNSTKAELWFETESGILRSFTNPFEDRSGEYCRNNQ